MLSFELMEIATSSSEVNARVATSCFKNLIGCCRRLAKKSSQKISAMGRWRWRWVGVRGGRGVRL